MAERPRDARELGDLHRVGALVHPVQHGEFPLVQVARHGDVGRDHELLDQALRRAARRGTHPRRRAEGVEDDLGLGQVEIEAAAGRAPALQEQGQLLHPEEMGQQVALLARGGGPPQQRVHPAVGQPRAAPDPAVLEGGPRQLPRASNVIRTLWTRRATWGRSEQRFSDSAGGSIGIARPGK